jgi:hypothetical protein
MNDFMYEQLVSRKTRAVDHVIRILVILLIVAIIVIGPSFIGLTALLLAIAVAAAAILFVFPRLKVEFEYILINHEIQIDAIYNRARRKSLLEFDLLKAEAILPKTDDLQKSHRIDKTYNCTSGTHTQDVYAILVNIKNQDSCILIEPDETMLAHINDWKSPIRSYH